MSDIESDVEANIHLSFMDAALGCKKSIRYKRQVSCSSCNGTGSAKGISLKTCGTCGGSGQVINFIFDLLYHILGI